MSPALRQMLDPSLFWEYRVVLLQGLMQNLSIFAESAILAIVAATIVALMQLGRNRPLRWIATGYTELCRNTPEYVLLVWVYFVLPLIVSKLIGSRFRLDPHVAAVIGLGAAYSGFMAETCGSRRKRDPINLLTIKGRTKYTQTSSTYSGVFRQSSV